MTTGWEWIDEFERKGSALPQEFIDLSAHRRDCDDCHVVDLCPTGDRLEQAAQTATVLNLERDLQAKSASPGDTTYPFAENETPNIAPQARGTDPWVDQGDTGNPEHNPNLQKKLKRKMITDEQLTGPTEVNYPGNGLMSEASLPDLLPCSKCDATGVGLIGTTSYGRTCTQCKGSGIMDGLESAPDDKRLWEPEQCYVCGGSGKCDGKETCDVIYGPHAEHADSCCGGSGIAKKCQNCGSQNVGKMATDDGYINNLTKGGLDYCYDCDHYLQSYPGAKWHLPKALSKTAAWGRQKKDPVYRFSTDDESHVVFMNDRGNTTEDGCTGCGWKPNDIRPHTDADFVDCYRCKGTGEQDVYKSGKSPCYNCKDSPIKGKELPDSFTLSGADKLQQAADHIRRATPKSRERQAMEDHFADSHGQQIGSNYDNAMRGRAFAEYFINTDVLNKMHEKLHVRPKCDICNGSGKCQDDIRLALGHDGGYGPGSPEADTMGEHEQIKRLKSHGLCATNGATTVGSCHACGGDGRQGEPAGHTHEGIRTAALNDAYNSDPQACRHCDGAGCTECKNSGVNYGRNVIRSDSMDRHDGEYWNHKKGWVSYGNETRYSDGEREWYSLPPDGYWEKLTGAEWPPHTDEGIKTAARLPEVEALTAHRDGCSECNFLDLCPEGERLEAAAQVAAAAKIREDIERKTSAAAPHWETWHGDLVKGEPLCPECRHPEGLHDLDPDSDRCTGGGGGGGEEEDEENEGRCGCLNGYKFTGEWAVKRMNTPIEGFRSLHYDLDPDEYDHTDEDQWNNLSSVDPDQYRKCSRCGGEGCDNCKNSGIVTPPTEERQPSIFKDPNRNYAEPHLGVYQKPTKTSAKGPKITFVQGDITQQDTDAIVNAANESLLGGGGVDGAIHRAAGPSVLEECKKIRATTHPDGLKAGEAVVTSGGNLRAKYIIHTVGPRYTGRKPGDRDPAPDSFQSPEAHPNPEEALRSAHTESLKRADEVGAQSVSFPAISTGIFGYPIDEASKVAVDAVRNAKTNVKEVRFVSFDDKTHAAYSAQDKKPWYRRGQSKGQTATEQMWAQIKQYRATHTLEYGRCFCMAKATDVPNRDCWGCAGSGLSKLRFTPCNDETCPICPSTKKQAQTWTQSVDPPVEQGKRKMGPPHLNDGETHVLEDRMRAPEGLDIKKWKTVKTFPGDKSFADHPQNQDHVDMGQVVGSHGSEACRVCGGKGSFLDYMGKNTKDCEYCKGSGIVADTSPFAEARFKRGVLECSMCKGTGKNDDSERSWVGDRCENCFGSGLSAACEDCGKELYRVSSAVTRLTGQTYVHSSVDRKRCPRYAAKKPKPVPCPVCPGTGLLNGDICWKCNGHGETYGYDKCIPCAGDGVVQRCSLHNVDRGINHDHCRGVGQLYEGEHACRFEDEPRTCKKCNGSGLERKTWNYASARVTNMDKIKNFLLKVGETDTHDATGGTPSHTCQACGKRHSDVSFDIDPKPYWRVDGMQGTEIDAENKAYWIAKEDKETLRYSPAASLRSHGYSDGPAETIHQEGFDEPATPFHIKVLWNPYIHERDHATMNLLHEAGHYMQAKQDWDTFHHKAQTPGPGIHGETAYERDAFEKGMDVAKAAGVRVTPNMKQQWKWAVGGEHLAARTLPPCSDCGGTGKVPICRARWSGGWRETDGVSGTECGSEVYPAAWSKDEVVECPECMSTDSFSMRDTRDCPSCRGSGSLLHIPSGKYKLCRECEGKGCRNCKQTGLADEYVKGNPFEGVEWTLGDNSFPPKSGGKAEPTKWIECHYCDGTGTERVCGACEGWGGTGPIDDDKTCGVCHGSGLGDQPQKCRNCHGSGLQAAWNPNPEPFDPNLLDKLPGFPKKASNWDEQAWAQAVLDSEKGDWAEPRGDWDDEARWIGGTHPFDLAGDTSATDPYRILPGEGQYDGAGICRGCGGSGIERDGHSDFNMKQVCRFCDGKGLKQEMPNTCYVCGESPDHENHKEPHQRFAKDADKVKCESCRGTGIASPNDLMIDPYNAEEPLSTRDDWEACADCGGKGYIEKKATKDPMEFTVCEGCEGRGCPQCKRTGLDKDFVPCPECQQRHDPTEMCEKLTGEESECRHCHRRILYDENHGWVDPEATGDDRMWRETCDAHEDDIRAEHEPEGHDPHVGTKQTGWEWIDEFKKDSVTHRVEVKDELIKCEFCGGTGRTTNCPDCNGHGDTYPYGVATSCTTCDGYGDGPERTCRACKGSGIAHSQDFDAFLREAAKGDPACQKCNGSGIVLDFPEPREVEETGLCSNCKGAGCSACRNSGIVVPGMTTDPDEEYMACPDCSAKGVIHLKYKQGQPAILNTAIDKNIPVTVTKSEVESNRPSYVVEDAKGNTWRARDRHLKRLPRQKKAQKRPSIPDSSQCICRGSGLTDLCHDCGGQGELWDLGDGGYFECPECKGSGRTEYRTCEWCEGTGTRKYAMFDYDPVRDVSPSTKSAPAPSAQGSGGDPWRASGDQAPPRPLRGYTWNPEQQEWVQDV